MSIEEFENLSPLAGLAFAKMTGTGNDFILVDNSQGQVPEDLMPLLARAVCMRRRSVGADGLIVLQPSDRIDQALGKVDWRWDFFNADGSAAEMCGNGGRCAARFAFDQGLAGGEMLFDTLAGPIRAWVGEGSVKLEMVPPSGAYRGLVLETDDLGVKMDGVNTGVPHAVILAENLEEAPVAALGRQVRYHRHFQPAGTNVNFAARGHNELLVRTYERGVEDETLACGTGAVASALMLGPRLGLKSPVSVRVRSGELLKVYFDQDGESFGKVFLEGAADYVFQGTLHQQAFAWLKY